MKNYFFLLMVGIFFLVSCEGEKIDYSILHKSIAVHADVRTSKTRLVNDTWSPGDAIGIYMFRAGEGLSESSLEARNAQYVTHTGESSFVPINVANDVKFPYDGSSVDFISYYPYGTVNSKFEYSIDISDQTDQSAIDFVYSDNAKLLNKNSGTVGLTFTRQLTKIVVKINTIDASSLSAVNVTLIGSNTKGKFSLVDKSITASTKKNIPMKVSSDGITAEAILFPLENLDGLQFEITNGDYGYRYDLIEATNIQRFEAGYKYTYKLTLDTRMPINVSATVSPWVDGAEESAIIEKDFEVYKPEGDGTKQNPYTIEDAQNIPSTQNVWVKGNIVGFYSGSNYTSFVPGKENAVASNIALATAPAETDAAKTVPVQLSIASVREALNLKDNPNLLGKSVLIKGDVEPYFGAPGLKNASEYELIP